MNTPIIARCSFYKELISHITILRQTYNNDDNYGGSVASMSTCCNNIQDSLNKIFEGRECINVIFTENTDSLPFGLVVNPTITSVDMINILVDDKDMNLIRYSLEIDSNIIPVLSNEELAAYIVETIYHAMGTHTISDLRSDLTTLLYLKDQEINIQDSINYSQIIIFGLKDVLRRLSNVASMDIEYVGTNPFIEAFEAKDDLEEACYKLKSSVFKSLFEEETNRMSVMNWVLMVYKELKFSCKDAQLVLSDSISYTGSVLMKDEIDKTIKAIGRASAEIVSESVDVSTAREVLNEKFGSFFAKLKRNGLRQVEDDLYEFRLRVKTCETEDEAIYVLKQINSRISLLEDYLFTTDVDEAEREKWLGVIYEFRRLREEIGKKKISNKKTYGIFVDYDKLGISPED